MNVNKLVIAVSFSDAIAVIVGRMEWQRTQAPWAQEKSSMCCS